MSQTLNTNSVVSVNLPQNNELAFAKLHATLSVLITKFHGHQCPKLAQFIVRHLSMMLEHPEVAQLDDCKTVYLQLLQHWQDITESLLIQRTMQTVHGQTLH